MDHLRLYTATVYTGATKRRDLQVLLDSTGVATAQAGPGPERDTVMLVVLNKISWQPGTLQWEHIRLTLLPQVGFIGE